MFSVGALAAAHAQMALPIYVDELAAGWQDWSWNTTVDFAAADPVSGVPDRAMAVTFDLPWAGLSLRHSPIDADTYDTLRFSIHGGDSGEQAIRVFLQASDSGGEQPAVALDDYLPAGGVPANAWADVAIPLADLMPTPLASFSRINWQDVAGGAQSTFLLDDLRLTGPAAGSVRLIVHTIQGIRHIPSTMFGSNAAFWNGNIHQNGDVVAKLAAAGVTVLRYPGGSSSDEHHWADYDPGQADNAWALNTSEFVGLAEAVSAEPMITANFGSGSAAEAAAWVQFTNVTHDWQVRYWEIGNEVYGSWETSWTHDGREYVLGNAGHDGANVICAAMKAVDPAIEVGVVGTLNASEYNGWGPAVLSNLSDCFDFYVIHRYPIGPGNTDYLSLLADPPTNWPPILADVQATLDTYAPQLDLDIAVTEYNAYWTEPEELQIQAVNLLYLADTLGQLIQGGVRMANHWDIINNLTGNGGDYGFLLVWDNYRRQPSYYHFPLWSHFGDLLIALDNTANPATTLSAYASLDGDELALIAINKSGNPITATLALEDFSPSGTGEAFVAQGASLDATTITYNGDPSPPVDLSSIAPLPVLGVSTAFSYTFPAYSVTSLRLHGAPACGWSDVDCDGAIEIDDLGALAGWWGVSEGESAWNARYDHNRDGRIDIGDIVAAAVHTTSRIGSSRACLKACMNSAASAPSVTR